MNTRDSLHTLFDILLSSPPFASSNFRIIEHILCQILVLFKCFIKLFNYPIFIWFLNRLDFLINLHYGPWVIKPGCKFTLFVHWMTILGIYCPPRQVRLMRSKISYAVEWDGIAKKMEREMRLKSLTRNKIHNLLIGNGKATEKMPWPLVEIYWILQKRRFPVWKLT